MRTWILLRAAGIGAYLMLFGTVAWGLVGTTSLFGKKISRATSIAVHQFLATAALVLIGLHLGFLAVDKFVTFKPADLLLPGHSAFKTIPVAVGVIAMYVAVVVLGSSYIRKRLSTKMWRALHLGAVPAFGMAMVHGIWTGTDSVRPWLFSIYLLTGLIVLFLMLTRVLTIGLKPERHALPPGLRTRVPTTGPAARQRPPTKARVPEFAGDGHHPAYKPPGSRG